MRAEIAAFTVREAEEARKRAESAAETDRITQHARSQQQAEEAKRALASPHSSLRKALAWFRFEWTAADPVRLHKADVAGDASPEWSDRWKDWLTAHDENRDPQDDSTRPPFDPLRRGWLGLRRSSSMFDRAVAEYLFRVASLGFDLEAAALTMDPPQPPPYIAGYAEKAIDRLRERVEGERHRPAPTVPQPEWMGRLGIGKSDAQHAAEEAA